MTKEGALKWMKDQIIACDLQSRPLDPNNKFFICNASYTGNRIHVNGIENLSQILGIPCTVENHSDVYDYHYFMYKGYRFFGLVEKQRSYEDERE